MWGRKGVVRCSLSEQRLLFWELRLYLLRCYLWSLIWFPLGFPGTGAAHLLTSRWLLGDTFSLRKLLFKYCDFHGFSLFFFLLFSFLFLHWSHGPRWTTWHSAFSSTCIPSVWNMVIISVNSLDYKQEPAQAKNSIFHWKMPRDWLTKEVFTGEKLIIWWDFRVCAREDQLTGGLLLEAETCIYFVSMQDLECPSALVPQISPQMFSCEAFS